MGDKTGIAWTDATWNALAGCTYASPGCLHCYARTLHDRRYLAWKRGRFADAPAQYRKPFKEVQLLPERLEIPLHWKKPRRVFVNSVSDLFHEDVPFEFVAEVFGVMAACSQHTFQVLTKRPERMLKFFAWLDQKAEFAKRVFPDDSLDWRRWHCIRAAAVRRLGSGLIDGAFPGWPLPNVWLGTSVEDQPNADDRLPSLVQVTAAVIFVSYEPALGPVDWSNWLVCPNCEGEGGVDSGGTYPWGEPAFLPCDGHQRRIDWLICGGESGPKYRPFDLDWARQARDQCVAANVPYFFKQVGGLTPKSGGDLLDGQTWHQFPEATRA